MPLTPNNREEHWLQGMVDGSTTLEPNKRSEYWYKEIIDAIGSGGGGGGGGAGVLIATMDLQTMALDKTWSEIYNAPFSVIKMCPAENTASFAYVSTIDGENSYTIIAYQLSENGLSPATFRAETADSYPVIDMG